MTHTKKLLYALLLTLALILMMSVGAAAIGNDAGVAGEGNNAADTDTNTSDVTSPATDTDGNLGSDSLNDTTDILDTDRADSEITDGTSNDQTADGNLNGTNNGGAADSIVNDAAEAATGGFGIWGIIIVILIIAAIVLLIFAFVPKKK